MIKLVTLFLLPWLMLSSCKQRNNANNQPSLPNRTPSSQKLAQNFPLLPLIENQLWKKLLKAEEGANNRQFNESLRTESAHEVERITALLQQRHPFQTGEKSITLGGISYDNKSRKISIPAIVQYPREGDKRHPGELEYPREGDKRHPGELEVILCSDTGRTHETMFVSKARPLHLELLLHLAGFKKTSPVSLFRLDVVVPNHPPIPAEALIKSASGDNLFGEMLWEFSGSDFQDVYSPDQTGDLIILWHAHDSVLQIQHETIASGEEKVLTNKHNRLPDGTEVTLVLSPRGP